MAITTDLDKFRLELGDTPAAYGLTPVQTAEFDAAALLNDDEVGYFLDGRPGSVLLAVADACDALARRYARRADFGEDGQYVKLSQIAAAYKEQAATLRLRATAGGGLAAIPLTKVDGYSDDLSTRDGAGPDTKTGRVRHGYYDPDTPPFG